MARKLNRATENIEQKGMLVFCDRLTLGMCAKLVWLRARASSGNRPRNIQVLDAIPRNAWHRTLKGAMRLLGFTLKEAQFFDGHLKLDTGEAVSLAASRWASATALPMAERIVSSSPFLDALNSAWGRNTISLDLARDLWPSIRDSSSRVLVASVLAREADAERAVMLLAQPHDFDLSYLVELGANLQLYFYRRGLNLSKTGRGFLIFWLLRQQSTRLGWRIQALAQRFMGRRPSVAADSKSPAILLIQEAEVSLDRSYRTQPHWLFEIDGRPPFQTYILEDGLMAASAEDSQELQELDEQGIRFVSRKEMVQTRYQGPSLPVQRQLSRDLRKCVVKSLFGASEPEIAGALSVGRLFFTAGIMTAFCREANIKAFLTGANYYREVDAIQLIAPALGIHTLSYQISIPVHTSPGLFTNADTMLIFSPLYHGLWTNDGIRPGAFVDTGYLYDTSFDLVRQRAGACRSRLEAAGAKFIICYFDENAGDGKYGHISVSDYHRDLLALMQMVLDDPAVGLVVKTKALWHSPRYIEEISDLRESVEATGRYTELMYGSRRNIVFPAEAALSADITIGHAGGGAAVLEGVLAGTRGILFNPYGAIMANHDLYAQADIIYPSMEAALEAIRALRAGVPERQNLGDWSAIIDRVDSFRDGQAGHRMRAVLEEAIKTPPVPV